MPENNVTTNNRIYGSIYGLVIGDAMGMPVEFKERDSFPEVTEFLPKHHWNLDPGSWTDDTSMTLALMDSITKCLGINPEDQLNRYVKWYMNGKYSVNGKCFDIGNLTRMSLRNYIATHAIESPYYGNEFSGNGSLMRHAPVPLFMYQFKDATLVEHASDVTSATTHSSKACLEYCRTYSKIIFEILQGTDKSVFEQRYQALMSLPRDSVRSSGFVGDTFAAAMWSFLNTDSIMSCIIKAVNLGDDADTVGAVAGSIAGAYYGETNIPLEPLYAIKKQLRVSEYLTAFNVVCHKFI